MSSNLPKSVLSHSSHLNSASVFVLSNLFPLIVVVSLFLLLPHSGLFSLGALGVLELALVFYALPLSNRALSLFRITIQIDTR